MCAELADLGMQLARAAAARTRADWAVAPPTAEPSRVTAEPSIVKAEPSSVAAEPSAMPAAEPPSEPAPATTPPYKQTDPAILFTRLAAVVRDCIALETRLAAGGSDAPHAASLQLRADPRRAPLRDAFRHALQKHPDRAELVRETTARLDQELAADADQTVIPGHIFVAICE